MPQPPSAASLRSPHNRARAQAGQDLLAACADPGRSDRALLAQITAWAATAYPPRSRAVAWPTPTDAQGRSPLILAALHQRPKGVRALLEWMAANDQDHDGATALMHAAQHSRLDVLDVLLPVSDPRITTPNGWNALMFAAVNDTVAVVQRLLPVTPASTLVQALEIALVNLNLNVAQTVLMALPLPDLENAAQMIDETLTQSFAQPVRPHLEALAQATRVRGEQAMLREALDGPGATTASLAPRPARGRSRL